MKDERIKEIRGIFERYRKNMREYEQLVLPTLKGVNYDKIAVQTDKSNNANEQLLINFLIDKEGIEKEIQLVDKVHDFYADDRDIELAHLIDIRFRHGKKHWQAVNEVYVSDRQGIRWLERAYEKAEEIGIALHIF